MRNCKNVVNCVVDVCVLSCFEYYVVYRTVNNCSDSFWVIGDQNGVFG